jgi:hypothetical protein
MPRIVLRTLGDLVDLLHADRGVLAVGPHVGDVDAVVGDDRLAERGDLAGVGEPAGQVVEARRQADGAGVHPLADQALHGLEVVVGGGPGVVAHHLHPDVAVGDQISHVDRDLAVEPSQVLLDAVPIVFQAVRIAVEPGGVAPHVVDSRGRPRRER